MNDFGTTNSIEPKTELFFAALAKFRDVTLAGNKVDIAGFCRNYPTIENELASVLESIVASPPPIDLTLTKRDIEQTLGADPILQTVRQLAGQRLGNYFLVRKLGEGAMGVVYEAEEVVLKKRVAVKITKTSELSELSSLRLKQEATIVASLQHDHIVPVFSFEENNGFAFYVMQLIQGDSLGQFRDKPSNLIERLHEPKHPPLQSQQERDAANSPSLSTHIPSSKTFRPTQLADAVARIGYDLALALQYAHALGIQHLDVKPSNVLLDHQGKIWLTDFGLAEIHQNQSSDQLWVGTIGYMSPEMLGLAASGRLGTSDIYSLGATLFCLLASRPPFTGELEEYQSWMIHGNLPSLRRFVPGLPKDLEAIINKALERDVSRRYQSAADMATDLKCYLERRPITSQPRTITDVLRKAIYRNRQTLTLVAAAAFLAMACFSYVSWLYYRRATNSETQYAQLVTDLFRDLDENGNLRKNADPLAQYQRLKLITDFLDSRDLQHTLTNRERYLLAQFHYYTAKQLADLRTNQTEVVWRLNRSAELFTKHYTHSGDPLHRLDAARSILFKAQYQMLYPDRTSVATARKATALVEQLNRDYPEDPRFLDAVACYSRVLADACNKQQDRESALQALERSIAVSKDLQAMSPERWWFYAFNECLAEQAKLAILLEQGDAEQAIVQASKNLKQIEDVIAAMTKAGETNSSMEINWMVTKSGVVEALIALNQPKQAIAEIDLWLERYQLFLAELPGTLQLRNVALGMYLDKIQLMKKLNYPEQNIATVITEFEATLPDASQLRTKFLLYHPNATRSDYLKSLAVQQNTFSQTAPEVETLSIKLLTLLLLDRISEAASLNAKMEESNAYNNRFYKVLILLKSGKYAEARETLDLCQQQAKANGFEERFALNWIETEMRKMELAETQP